MPALDSKPAFLVDPGTGELSANCGLTRREGIPFIGRDQSRLRGTVDRRLSQPSSLEKAAVGSEAFFFAQEIDPIDDDFAGYRRRPERARS
jgi:hypothetical protein